jgi:endonuclease/exonuclease/phosphatase family metal-dependent hydrolase
MSNAAASIGAGGHQTSRKRHRLDWFPRVLVVLGWMLVASLAVVAFLRLVAWDSLEPLIVLNALTLIVYLPAWVVAIAAAIGRKWWLTAAAVVICAVQVVFAAPEFLAASAVPSWARHATAITVFDANIDKSFQFEAGYVHAIAQNHPDLITLEEFTPSALLAMVASGVLEAYPYRCVAPAVGATGFLIASKIPMAGCQTKTVLWDGMPTPYLVDATLSTPAGQVQLRLVHTLAPLPAYWHEWSAALAAVDQMVRSGSDARTLMVGDFNATWGNSGFITLVHSGLTDAAAARGEALDMTWPNGALVPTFVRIDHLLTGSQLATTVIHSGPGFGSDHRYLTATVAIRGRA